MAHSIPYRLGAFVRRYPFVPLAALLLLLLYLTLDGRNTPSAPAPVAAPVAVKPAAPVIDPACSSGLDALVAKAKALTAKGQPVPAYDVLYPCRDQLLASAQAGYYKNALSAYDQASSAALRKAEADDKARKKREGVSLGMSREDVLASSWGKPDKINRTTGIWGTSEQWVYRTRFGGYLYFENDVLTTVQH